MQKKAVKEGEAGGGGEQSKKKKKSFAKFFQQNLLVEHGKVIGKNLVCT